MRKIFSGLVMAGIFVLGVSNIWAADCLQDPTEYAAKLEVCEMFSCIFEQPFSGTKMNKHILGIENGKCKTQEEMPNKGLVTCQFSEKQRKEVAAYLRKTAKAQTIESKTTIDIAGGKSKQTEKQDGKVVKNPLNEAMQDGTCVVSGYGVPEASQPKTSGGCETDDDCPATCKHCKLGKQMCMHSSMEGREEIKCVECGSSWLHCKKGYKCDENIRQCAALAKGDCVEDSDCKESCAGCKSGRQRCNTFEERCIACSSPFECKEGYRCVDKMCVAGSN